MYEQFKAWWIEEKKFNPSTAKKNFSAVVGRVNQCALKHGITIKSLAEITSAEEFEQVREALLSNQEFMEFDSTGNRMYSSALNHYLSFLKSGTELRDFEAELARLPETELIQVIRARNGQGNYREEVIKLWDGKCAVTGYNDIQMLIASHIKPWSLADNVERLDKCNGLLLTPNIDKVFDKGLITFRPTTGKIRISRYLERPDLLGLHDNMKLRMRPPQCMRSFLEYHNDILFYTHRRASTQS